MPPLILSVSSDDMQKTKKILAWLLAVSAIGFGIAGFVVPPVGIINSSVLWLIAQFNLFSATLLGIDLEYAKLLKK